MTIVSLVSTLRKNCIWLETWTMWKSATHKTHSICVVCVSAIISHNPIPSTREGLMHVFIEFLLLWFSSFAHSSLDAGIPQSLPVHHPSESGISYALTLNPFSKSPHRRRHKRDLNNFMIPYTKWCGKGWSAKKYSEIGGYSKTGIFLSLTRWEISYRENIVLRYSNRNQNPNPTAARFALLRQMLQIARLLSALDWLVRQEMASV